MNKKMPKNGIFFYERSKIKILYFYIDYDKLRNIGGIKLVQKIMKEKEKKATEQEKIQYFISHHPRSHFLQSPEWARVKKDWEHEEIIIKDENGEIKGYLSILLRKVPVLNKYIMYSARGPICDVDDEKTFLEIVEKCKQIAKKYKAFIFRMDPDIEESNENFQSLAKKAGFKIKKNIKNINQVIQPKYVFRLNMKDKTEEELLASFGQKTRYNIRLATKKGVTTRIGEKEDLKIFHKIMSQTGARDEFIIRPLSYYETIYEELGPKHVRIIIAEYENEPIAAVFPVYYGNKVWYLYGGSSNNKRNLMPNYLLQWEMIKWAKEKNCDIYDFRGVSGFKDEKDPQYGVYKFKKGFNPDFVEFIGELNMVFRPITNGIFNIMSNIFNLYKRIKYHK